MNSAMTQQVLHGTIGRAVHILLVEDSPSDVAMIRAALREGHIANDMYVAGDGEEALNYLFRRGEFRDARRPDLILLDLLIPPPDGLAVIRAVKKDRAMSTIPLVVMPVTCTPRVLARCTAGAPVPQPTSRTSSLGVRSALSSINEVRARVAVARSSSPVLKTP